MKRRLDLIITHSITAPGHLSVRAVDEFGNQRSLQSALSAAGFKPGDKVVLTDEEDITVQLLEPDIEIVEDVNCNQGAYDDQYSRKS